MSYFTDIFSTASKDRLLIGDLLSQLITAGLVPKEESYMGFTIHISDELNKRMAQRSDADFSRAMDLVVESDFGREVYRRIRERSGER